MKILKVAKPGTSPVVVGVLKDVSEMSRITEEYALLGWEVQGIKWKVEI